MIDIEKLKEFIKENLEIVVECEFQYSPGQNQTVGLRFKGDDDCFTEETIIIPEGD